MTFGTSAVVFHDCRLVCFGIGIIVQRYKGFFYCQFPAADIEMVEEFDSKFNLKFCLYVCKSELLGNNQLFYLLIFYTVTHLVVKIDLITQPLKK